MAERRLHILNNSRSAAFRRCPRKHYYAYELAIVPVEKSDALVTGSRWHKSLEAWWLAVKDGKREQALEAALAALKPAEDPYEQIRAESVLTGYHVRWIDEPLEVIGVEVPYEAPLIDPITGAECEWTLGGTIDAICRSGDRTLVVEHKTSSQDFSPGAYYWQKLTLNSQVSQYLGAGPSLGLELSGCLYDVIGKAPNIAPKLATPEADRKYTKEGKLYARQRESDEPLEDFRERLLEAISSDPSKFYGRAEIVRIGDELEQALLDNWQIGEQITEARELNRWPRNTDSCFDFNRECEYFGACARGEDLENSDRFVKEREEKNHEQVSQ